MINMDARDRLLAACERAINDYETAGCEDCGTISQETHDAIVDAVVFAKTGKGAFGIYKSDPIKRDDPEHAKEKPAQQWVAEQSRSQFGTWEVYTSDLHYRALDPTAPGCSPETSRKVAVLQAAAPQLLEACKMAEERFRAFAGANPGACLSDGSEEATALEFAETLAAVIAKAEARS